VTDEELKKQIAANLDIQNLHDIKAVMATADGRRFFSWLIMSCGQNNTSFTRDSRTYFNEGMRNVALLLESCVKALGLSGVDLMHQAEREYIVFQEAIKREIQEKQKGGK
jgi:hypothetical protein